MDPIKLSIISIIISSVGTLIVGITAIILWLQLKTNHEWNRRKATQETLDKLVVGEFPELRRKLEVELKCSIWDGGQDYKSCITNLSEETSRQFDGYLSRILNIFETVGINIKNNILMFIKSNGAFWGYKFYTLKGL